MNLNELAESDLQFTIEDSENGFGVALKFLDSEGEEVEIVCSTTDIGFFIDPQTGEGVQGRTVKVNGRIATFESKNVEVKKDAIVKYYDTLKNEYKACVKQVTPDRKLGVQELLLEARK